jgi:CheY-like chemotaxis protein
MMPQRISVVDDDREIVRLMRTYLEKSNYEVLVAYDGGMALHILRRERPDLVLLDLMLPERDGWDVTRVVQGRDALRPGWRLPNGQRGRRSPCQRKRVSPDWIPLCAARYG